MRHLSIPSGWYIYAQVDSYPDNILIKYFYEPTGTWHSVQIPSSSMKIGTLRAEIFRQKFPHLATMPEKYMDAVQIYYTMPYLIFGPTGRHVPDDVPRDAEDPANRDRIPQAGRLDNSRYLQYYPYKPREMMGADNYYIRVLDENGEFWPAFQNRPEPVHVPKCMDITLHTHVKQDGKVEGRHHMENDVMYYDGRPKTQQRNLQRFQNVLQDRLTNAISSASGPTELQTDTIAAIAHAMRHSVATLPDITYSHGVSEPAYRPY